MLSLVFPIRAQVIRNRMSLDPVSNLDPNIFGPQTIPWRRACIRALCVNAVLVALVLLLVATATGADNPIGLYAGFVLQFPASLLFEPILGALSVFLTSDVMAMIASAAVVTLLQFIALALFFKRPWR